MESQVEPGQPKDHQLIRKKEGHTNPPDQEEGSRMCPGKRFLGSSLKLQVFLLHKVNVDNKVRIFEISDDSESEDNIEAASGELRNDLPLSDPISEFPTSHETSKVGKGRARKNFIAEGKGSLLSLENDRDHLCLLGVGHQNRRHALNGLTLRRKTLPLLHGKLVPLIILIMILHLPNGKLVPLICLTLVLVPLHGKLVPPLILMKFRVQLNGKLVPQLFLAVCFPTAMKLLGMVVIPGPNLANMELSPYLMECRQLSGYSLRSLVVPQRPYCLLRTMKHYDVWFVRSLDIGLMRSGATQRQAQHAFTFLMFTSLLKMVVCCSVNLQLCFLVSDGLLSVGPHVRTSPMLDTCMVYWAWLEREVVFSSFFF